VLRCRAGTGQNAPVCHAFPPCADWNCGSAVDFQIQQVLCAWGGALFKPTKGIYQLLHAAPLYRAAAQQYRKLKTLLNRLDKLSKTILRHQAKLAESKPQD